MERLPELRKLEDTKQSENFECTDSCQTLCLKVDQLQRELKNAENDDDKVKERKPVLKVLLRADTEHLDDHLQDENEEENQIQMFHQRLLFKVSRVLVETQNDRVKQNAKCDESLVPWVYIDLVA